VNLFFPQTAVVSSVWQAIEDFCLQAKEKPNFRQALQLLHLGGLALANSVLAAVLLQHVNDVSVYRDGTFIPVLEQNTLSYWLKTQVSCWHFEVAGLRSQFFKELKLFTLCQCSDAAMSRTTLVKPLFQFVKKLPASTTRTKPQF